MSEHWRARALIDLAAFEHNLTTVRRLAGKAKVFAVVKADAYGHGIENIVSTAKERVDGFAVATLDEGIQCRRLSPDSPIMVLSEFNARDQLRVFEENRLQPVLHSEHQLNWLKRYRGSPLDCWVKIDTGMNRLGINQSVATAFIEMVSQIESVKSMNIMSHLASADIKDSDQNDEQLTAFRDLTRRINGLSSMGNSAAVLRSISRHFDMVRPGLLLYGASPMTGTTGISFDLKPVMQLEARLIEVKRVQKGQKVGYGGCWTAPSDCTIAVASLGYADGYPRAVSNRGYALVNGSQAPVVGMVSMDMTTLNVSNCGQVKEGDIVQFWGAGIAVEKVAEWSDTISYELLCRVSPRVPRVILN